MVKKILTLTATSALAAFSLGTSAIAQTGSMHGGMTTEQHKQMMAGRGADSKKVTHATGVVKSVDRVKRTITIAHDPIAAKKWPAMTMTLKVNKSVLGQVKTGQRVKFRFVGEDSYTVTKMTRI